MTENDLKAALSERISEIDDALKIYLKREDNPQSLIYDAMAYSVFAGGKRLRPILMIECAKMCGGADNVMPFACAMEMIHTYSLIHDDLPAMDNDDLRRGIPTSHIKYGEATAILAGDALLNKAFEIMSENCRTKNDVQAMRRIAVSSGTEGMIGGQVVDILNEGKRVKIEELKYLHSLKTGAIIRSSCVAGAILAGESDTKAIDEFALNLGIAFQIRDDILDVCGDEKELGKPIGSDDNKTTYVTLLGTEDAKKLVGEYSEKAKNALKSYGKKADFLTALSDYLINRRK